MTSCTKPEDVCRAVQLRDKGIEIANQAVAADNGAQPAPDRPPILVGLPET